MFLKANGICHIWSTPYHPAMNGLTERFVQSLKQSLKASLRSGLPLSQCLRNFLMTYCSTVHSTTGVTPSSLFLKRELRTRFDLLRPDPSVDVHHKQSQQKSDHDRHSSTRQFAVGDLVMARNFDQGQTGYLLWWLLSWGLSPIWWRQTKSNFGEDMLTSRSPGVSYQCLNHSLTLRTCGLMLGLMQQTLVIFPQNHNLLNPGQLTPPVQCQNRTPRTMTTTNHQRQGKTNHRWIPRN